MVAMICWKCKRETSINKPVRGDECPFCHADLHACCACRFYEKGVHNDCRETSAEFTADKERSNFCDYFTVSEKLLGTESGNDGSLTASQKAKNAAAALFGDDSIKKDSGSAKSAFDALFS